MKDQAAQCFCWHVAAGRLPVSGDALQSKLTAKSRGSSCGPAHDLGDSLCWLGQSSLVKMAASEPIYALWVEGEEVLTGDEASIKIAYRNLTRQNELPGQDYAAYLAWMTDFWQCEFVGRLDLRVDGRLIESQMLESANEAEYSL